MKLIATIILDGAEIEIENGKLKTEGFRPDILHQCLITLLDTSLSKNGRLLVFFRTLSNQIFYISHKCRIPRTFNEFSLFIVELVTKFKIRSNDTNRILARAIKGDFITLFGNNAIGLSSKGVPMKSEDWVDFIPTAEHDDTISINQLNSANYENPMNLQTDIPPFVVGVRAHEGLKDEIATKLVSIAPIGLTAAHQHCCAKLVSEIEHLWRIY